MKLLEARYYDTMDSMRRLATRQIQTVAAKILNATPMDEDIFYQRVVVILRKKDESKILMKTFKFIPRDSLQVLFLENQKRMGSLNALLMYGTLLPSLANLAWNYYHGNTVHTELAVPMSLILYRFYYNYDYKKKRYDATTAQLFYENNLSNNIGVCHEIIDRAESERFTSSIILYAALLHEVTVSSRTSSDPYPFLPLHQIDDKVERWITEFASLEKVHDFDEVKALHNLLKIGLVTVDERDERRHVRVKSIDEAIQVLRDQIILPGAGVYAAQDTAEWNKLTHRGPFSGDYNFSTEDETIEQFAVRND